MKLHEFINERLEDAYMCGQTGTRPYFNFEAVYIQNGKLRFVVCDWLQFEIEMPEEKQ